MGCRLPSPSLSLTVDSRSTSCPDDVIRALPSLPRQQALSARKYRVSYYHHPQTFTYEVEREGLDYYRTSSSFVYARRHGQSSEGSWNLEDRCRVALTILLRIVIDIFLTPVSIFGSTGYHKSVQRKRSHIGDLRESVATLLFSSLPQTDSYNVSHLKLKDVPEFEVHNAEFHAGIWIYSLFLTVMDSYRLQLTLAP